MHTSFFRMYRSANCVVGASVAMRQSFLKDVNEPATATVYFDLRNRAEDTGRAHHTDIATWVTVFARGDVLQRKTTANSPF